MVESTKNSDIAKDTERLLSPEESDGAIARLSKFPAELRDNASSFLAPEQVAALESTQKNLRDMVKMASPMTSAMGGE